jgi:hypothetical protein
MQLLLAGEVAEAAEAVEAEWTVGCGSATVIKFFEEKLL